MELQDEIKAMVSGDSPEEIITDKIMSEEESEDGRIEEEEAETTAETSEETDVEEREVEETLESRYNRLLDEHNKQSTKLLELLNRQGYGPEQKHVVGEPQLTQTPAPVVEPKFKIDKARIEKAILEGDADSIVGLLEEFSTFVAQRLTDQQEMVRERVLLQLPTVAREVARNEFTLFSAVKEFYSENPDLMPYQAIVGSITNEVAASNPQLPLNEVLVEVEKVTRQRLGLRKKIQEISGGRGTQSFAKARSAKKIGSPKLEGLHDDIKAMQEAASRW